MATKPKGGWNPSMNIVLNKHFVSFWEIEQILWKELRALFCQTLKELLEGLDQQVFESRDKNKYKVCEIRGREIETLVGPVKFKRRAYRNEETGQRAFLLDQALELAKRERISPGLVELVTQLGVTGPSYRQARENITKIFGERIISHEAIRQVVIHAGEKIDQLEEIESKTLQGQRKVPILFLEVDGLWVSLQQEKEPSTEIKTMTSHEGWQKRYESSKEYQLKNQFHFTWDKKGDFWEEASLYIEAHYDIENTMVVINGDRAKWIRKGIEYFPEAIYQVDRYHLKRDIRLLLKNQPDKLEKALQSLEESNTASFFAIIAEAVSAEKDQKIKNRQQALLKDLVTIPDSIRDYRKRLQEKGYDVTGLRGLGAAESQIDRYSNRLKKRSQSWGKRGLHSMLSCLDAKFEGTLEYAVKLLRDTDMFLNKKELKTKASKIAAKITNDIGHVKKGHFPVRETGRHSSGGLSILARRLSHPAFTTL